MDVHLNHEGKISITLWTITYTYSIDYNCFDLSKVFIKIYSTDIPIKTVFICTASGFFVHYCQLFTLCYPVHYPTRDLLRRLGSDQTFTGGFFLFTVVPYSSTESLTEYLIAPVFWVTITLYCQCHNVPPFHFQIYTT